MINVCQQKVYRNENKKWYQNGTKTQNFIQIKNPDALCASGSAVRFLFELACYYRSAKLFNFLKSNFKSLFFF